MNKKLIIFILFVIFVAVVGIYITLNIGEIASINDRPVVCTMEAMICPDGSSVGRVGPNCEFAACKDTDTNSPVKLNQKATMGGISITPLAVLSDSRCPKDSQCIWAGTVVLNAKLEKGVVEKEVKIELGKEVVFSGTSIVLEKVLPEKLTSSQKTSKYSFVFSANPAK